MKKYEIRDLNKILKEREIMVSNSDVRWLMFWIVVYGALGIFIINYGNWVGLPIVFMFILFFIFRLVFYERI